MSQPGLQRPTNKDDREEWKAYWQEQGMPWRTEPEIDDERKRYLAARKSVKPDIRSGIYAFRDENGGIRLTRADVEWLLATNDSSGLRGPVNWEDPAARRRTGIDLRGANLEEVNLDSLPLANLRGGLTGTDIDLATTQESEWASIHLERATLRYALLQGSALTFAHMGGVSMKMSHLEGADMYGVRLASEIPADMSGCVLNESTVLRSAKLANAKNVGPRLRHVHWGGAQLLSVGWSNIHILDDERRARRRGKRVEKGWRMHEYERAVSANQLLTNALRSQGLNEDCDRIAYRAQLCQRRVLRLQRHYLRAFGSWLLDVVSGYGYRPVRSIIAYILIVSLFAAAYFLNAQVAAPHLTWDESIVLSISAFHGRGFFTSGISLGDTLARLAAAEAIIGLLLEITFIATFTQRFFAR